MEHLIASYLFQNNYCPLPSIGTLKLSEKPALVSHGARRIEAPQPVIALITDQYPEEDFLDFISFNESVNKEEARARLKRFCDQLHSLDSYAEAKIPNTGKFYVNAEGNLVFRSSSFPSHYRDSIVAEKVIHPDASHSLLVGDKESSTSQMTEYYNVEEIRPRKKWWIAALVLGLAGLAIIFYYYYNETDKGLFGNAAKPAVSEGTPTYTTPK